MGIYGLFSKHYLFGKSHAILALQPEKKTENMDLTPDNVDINA